MIICLIQYFEADQPKNPKFRNNPENFHPSQYSVIIFYFLVLFGVLGSGRKTNNAQAHVRKPRNCCTKGRFTYMLKRNRK